MAKRRLRKSNFAIAIAANAAFNSSGSNTLANLPTELIWHIASYLRTPTLTREFVRTTVRRRTYDLCALRLSCRSLRDKVERVFLPIAFESLEVDLIRSDLNMLVEISKDSRCSAIVKELHFVMAEAWPDTDDWSDEFNQEMIERDYIEKGTGAILLSRALNGFSNLRTVMIQPVMWFPGNSRFIFARSPHGEGSTTSLVATILAALSLSDTRIQTLAFSRRPPFTDRLNGPTGCYVAQFNIPSNSMAAFRNLRTVDLIVAVRPSKRFELSSATALTSFVSNLPQLSSLSIRFDSHILSEMVTRELLTTCQIPTLTWFRLEVAFIWDTTSGCPLIEFLQRNKQIQHLQLNYVDLDDDRWDEVFAALSTCEDLRTVALQYITQATCAVLINRKKIFRIAEIEDTSASLSEARREIEVEDQGHDEGPCARYEKYPEDSEYEFDGEE